MHDRALTLVLNPEPQVDKSRLTGWQRAKRAALRRQALEQRRSPHPPPPVFSPEHTARYAYEPRGLLAELQLGPHPPLKFRHDDAGREVDRAVELPGDGVAGTTPFHLRQRYDAVGQLLEQALEWGWRNCPPGEELETFRYDAARDLCASAATCGPNARPAGTVPPSPYAGR